MKENLFLDVLSAAERIKAGGVVGFPTETVYGLGADALNAQAVAKIYEIKKRPLDHPLIVHIADKKDLSRLVKNIPEKARLLTDHFWPGPLTILLHKSPLVPDITTGGLETIGVRIPNHPVALDFIRAGNTPIAAPSANTFGTISPTEATHVCESLGDKVDGVIDGGRSQVGLESTIISFLEDEPVLLRPGGLSVEDIESVIGKIQRADLNAKPIASGMLKKHYSPATPLYFFNHFREVKPELFEKAGVLCFQEAPVVNAGAIEILSRSGDLREAAANLFSALRRLDQKRVPRIIAFSVPDEGLGLAINDRLERASQ